MRHVAAMRRLVPSTKTATVVAFPMSPQRHAMGGLGRIACAEVDRWVGALVPGSPMVGMGRAACPCHKHSSRLAGGSPEHVPQEAPVSVGISS